MYLICCCPGHRAHAENFQALVKGRGAEVVFCEAGLREQQIPAFPLASMLLPRRGFLVSTGMWFPSLHCRRCKFAEDVSRLKHLDRGISHGKMLRSEVLRPLQSLIFHLSLLLAGFRASRCSSTLKLRVSITFTSSGVAEIPGEEPA